MNDRSKVKTAITQLLDERGPNKTICPSEVARRVEPTAWRDVMDLVRDVADELVQAGGLEVVQRGTVIGSATAARGAIRLRRRQDETDATASKVREDPRYTFAIVGLGPRGSYALECLVDALHGSPHGDDTAIVVFDDTPDLGAGHVWSPSQAASNWVNINERLLDLGPRTPKALAGVSVPGFPSYHEWAKLDNLASTEPDTYPPRAKVGRYFTARSDSLLKPLVQAGMVTFVNARVGLVERGDERWSLFDANGDVWRADDVLLTIGHQPTNLDDQIEGWSKAVGPSAALFTQPYPVSRITNEALGQGPEVTVAIRGYGLAMMDVVRALAGAYGSFDDGGDALTYALSAEYSLRVVPFSLDGLPMSPKPRTPALDEPYTPTRAELERVGQLLADRSAQQGATSAHFLIDAVAPVISRVYADLDVPTDGEGASPSELDSVIRRWLADPQVEHPAIVGPDTPPVEALERYTAMATGNRAASLDYCIGQVWRHCQPTIYKSLSHSALGDDVLAATIALDERMKRYAFGPPVQSIQQLLALVRARVLVLDFVADPDIECTDSGWTLTSGDASVVATVMVDSVLDSPTLEAVVAPIVTGLLEDSVIHPVHDKLGIATRQDGTVVSGNGDPLLPLSVLGRLAKGTLVGVDAILECYGDRPREWARSALERRVAAAVE